jgi:hypothetical protein
MGDVIVDLIVVKRWIVVDHVLVWLSVCLWFVSSLVCIFVFWCICWCI